MTIAKYCNWCLRSIIYTNRSICRPKVYYDFYTLIFFSFFLFLFISKLIELSLQRANRQLSYFCFFLSHTENWIIKRHTASRSTLRTIIRKRTIDRLIDEAGIFEFVGDESFSMEKCVASLPRLIIIPFLHYYYSSSME